MVIVSVSVLMAVPLLGSSTTPQVFVAVFSVEFAVIRPSESSSTLQYGSGFSPSRSRVSGSGGNSVKLELGIPNSAWVRAAIPSGDAANSLDVEMTLSPVASLRPAIELEDIPRVEPSCGIDYPFILARTAVRVAGLFLLNVTRITCVNDPGSRLQSTASTVKRPFKPSGADTTSTH